MIIFIIKTNSNMVVAFRQVEDPEDQRLDSVHLCSTVVKGLEAFRGFRDF